MHQVSEVLEGNVNVTMQLLLCRETPCCTVVRNSSLYAWKWVLNLFSNSRSTEGYGYWVNHHIKKGNMIVVMTDLDQNLFPSTASFFASFFFH